MRRPKIAEYRNLGLWYSTPLGLRANAMRHPKIAEYRNLGLWCATPLGLGANAWCDCLSQGSGVPQPWAVVRNPVGVESFSLLLPTFLPLI